MKKHFFKEFPDFSKGFTSLLANKGATCKKAIENLEGKALFAIFAIELRRQEA